MWHAKYSNLLLSVLVVGDQRGIGEERGMLEMAVSAKIALGHRSWTDDAQDSTDVNITKGRETQMTLPAVRSSLREILRGKPVTVG